MNGYIVQAEDLLPRLVAGDKQAFAELVDQTSGRIYGLALRMLNNQQDAEDVLQETYLKAFKALPGFENRSSIFTWLFSIATNEALMVLRKRKASALTIDIDEETEEQDDPLQIVDWANLPENEIISLETRLQLQKGAESLSPLLKVVFLLRDVQGFSVTETAEILKVSESVIKTRLVRARMKLRGELSEYFAEKMEKEGQNG